MESLNYRPILYYSTRMNIDEFIDGLESHVDGTSTLSDDAEDVGRSLAHLPD